MQRTYAPATSSDATSVRLFGKPLSRSPLTEPPRRFSRFRHDAPLDSPVSFRLPGDGLCLNAFLVVHEVGHPGNVLMGQLDPDAPWGSLGGLDADRAQRSAGRWMLPASQLQFFESPQKAGERIVREMLGTGPLTLRGPEVFSEAYARSDSAKGDPHWDLHFIFHAELPRTPPPRASPWKELEFVEISETSRKAIARAHGDILALAGVAPKD